MSFTHNSSTPSFGTEISRAQRLQEEEVAMSEYFNMAYIVADHAAEVGRIWQLVQAGHHDEGAKPTIREIGNPIRYPLPPRYDQHPDAANFAQQLHRSDQYQGIDLPFQHYEALANQILHNVEAEEAIRIPLDHPGPEWHFNHPNSKRFYPLMIEHEGRWVRAKYIRYHRQVAYPEINGTMGINQPIHVTNLRLPKEYKGQDVLTLPEQKIFDPQMQMQEEIDSALEYIDDWALTSEVTYYRKHVEFLELKHHEATHIRDQIADTMEDIKHSVWRLSQGKAYERIMNVLDREEDPIMWISNQELKKQMQRESEEPTPPNRYICKWCQISSHATRECTLFLQCFYCRKYGHDAPKCFHPHRRCHQECIVEPNHPKYNDTCRTRIYSSDSSNSRSRRRETRRQARIQRRANRRVGL